MFIEPKLQDSSAPLGAECKLRLKQHSAPLERTSYLGGRGYKHCAPPEHSCGDQHAEKI